VEERSCGGFSGATPLNTTTLACATTCEKVSDKISPGTGEAEKYVADILQLALTNPRYVDTLERRYVSVAAGEEPTVVLPPCDTARRLLAVEYARLHWGLSTVTSRDSVEGWWCVQIVPAGSARTPRPLLSELVQQRSPASMAPSLGVQPRLCFSGIKGAGDEVYDLLGNEGLMGVRSGYESGELIAFMSRSAVAVEAFKRLTGQTSGIEVVVRSTVGGSAVLRVSLEQTLAGNAAVRRGGTNDGWDTVPSVEITANRSSKVPDSWEDA